MRQDTINRRLEAFVKANKKANELRDPIRLAWDMECYDKAKDWLKEQRKQIDLANSNSKRLSERAGLFVVYEISMDHYKLQNLYCGKAFKKPFDWNNPSKPLYTYEIAEDISTTRDNQEKYYQELRSINE